MSGRCCLSRSDQRQLPGASRQVDPRARGLHGMTRNMDLQTLPPFRDRPWYEDDDIQRCMPRREGGFIP